MDSAAATDKDRRFSRLSLIDFAFEDDFLLASPSADLHDLNSLDITKEDEELDDIRQLETTDSSRVEERTDGFEQREDEPPLLPSSDPERVKRDGKYNLRKSLAWDSAFFTSAGFLDAEELTSMIAPVGRNEKRVLPVISEDVQKSSDSISTLGSEIMPLENNEGSLFDDVRASIQKSSGIIGKSNSRIKAESGHREERKLPSLGRLDLTSQNKMKDLSASNMLTNRLQGPGRTIKQNSSQPRGGQQLKAVSKLPSNSTKRPSHGVTVNDGTASGAGPADRRDSVSLRTNAHKLSRLSTAGKRDQKTSSEVSVRSSDKVGKSSSEDARRKTEGKAPLSSDRIRKTQLGVEPKVKAPIGNSRLSSYLTSQTKHSSGISPASSISEWSTESSSRASLHSNSSKRISIDSDTSHDGRNHDVGPRSQTTGQSQSVKKISSNSSLLPSASTKPSGLRLPSPKFGYFDGGKTSTMKSDLPVPSGLTKIGAGNVSTSGGQNKTKPHSKLQPARSLPKSATRANTHPNLKSHKPTATKMSKRNEPDQEIEKLGCDGPNTGLHDSDGCANSSAMGEKMSQENEASSNINELTTMNADGEPNWSPKFGS